MGQRIVVGGVCFVLGESRNWTFKEEHDEIWE